jgi:hypothetical protein
MGARPLPTSVVTILPVIFLAISLLSANFSRAELSRDGVTSENIADHLSPGPGYPLVGFWKDHCEDDFGLAIDRAVNGLYSISFCGPGGCFAPGTYRQNSPIVGDPDYVLVDQDTLQVWGRDGFSTYFRCTAKSAKPAA